MVKRAVPKWKLFPGEYIIDFNATKAAERCKFSKKTAASQGARLLKDVKVQVMIQELMAKREKRTEIKQDRVLQEIAKIAFADIKDFLKYRTVKVKVGEADSKPVYEHRQEIILKPSSRVDGTMIGKVSLTKQGTFSFELHDKGRNLEMLARHVGILKEPTVNVNIEVDLAGRVKAGRERVKARNAAKPTGDTGRTPID